MDPYVLYAMPASLYSGKARCLSPHPPDRVRRAGSGRPPLPAPRSSRSSAGGSSPCSRPPTGRSSRTPSTSSTILDATVPPDRSAYPATASAAHRRPPARAVRRRGPAAPGHALPVGLRRRQRAVPGQGLQRRPGRRGRRRHPRGGVRLRLGADARRHRRLRGDRGAESPRSSAPTRSSSTSSTPTWPARPICSAGGPTIADYGFMGPLYAHLARDPYPSVLMKQRAQRVWRWTERMNAPVLDASEYGDCGTRTCSPTTGFRDSLRALLAYIGEEYLDEARGPGGRPSTPGWPTTPRWPTARSCSANPNAGSAAPPPSPGGAGR